MFERNRPHVFRERRVDPDRAVESARQAARDAEELSARHAALLGYAVHQAHDLTRVITVETWASEADARPHVSRGARAAIHEWAGTGGIEPTPVADPSAGVIVIDIFPVWRPLLRPVSAFNLRNGEAFNQQPGCISTTVLRGLNTGSIATYARWRSVEDFLRAFEATTGGKVASTADINAWATRKTFGLIRPDYHSYELVASGGSAGI